MLQNAQTFPGVYYSKISLKDSFPLHYRLAGTRDDKPIDAFHTHNVLELGLCLEGHGTYYVGEKLLPFQAGDVTVITPLEWHRSQSAKGTLSTWAWFFFDPARLLVPSLTRDLPYVQEVYSGRDFNNVLARANHPGLASLLEEMVHEARSRGEGFEANLKALLLVFLTRLDRLTGGNRVRKKREASSTPVRIMPALDVMARKYHEDWRIGDLAKQCHMSVRNFQLHFKKIMKQTPQSYLVQCRVQAAVALLRATEHSITDVAYECGFGSLSSFNRAFRASTGQSPRDFRKAGDV